MKSYAMLCYAIYFSIQFTHANISNSSLKKLLENGYTTMEADPVQGSATLGVRTIKWSSFENKIIFLCERFLLFLTPNMADQCLKRVYIMYHFVQILEDTISQT